MYYTWLEHVSSVEIVSVGWLFDLLLIYFHHFCTVVSTTKSIMWTPETKNLKLQNSGVKQEQIGLSLSAWK